MRTANIQEGKLYSVQVPPYKRTHQSEHPNGVEITWEAQEVDGMRRHFATEHVLPGRAIVNARAVRHEIEEA